MLRAILLSLVFCTSAFGYTSKNVRLTQNEFLVRVKPQLNNIKQDYQTLIGALNPALKVYKPIFSNFKQMNNKVNRFISNCQTLNNKNCLNISQIYINQLEKILSKMERSTTPESLKYHPAEQVLLSFDKFQEVRSILLDVYIQFSQFHFFYQANIIYTQRPRELLKQIDKAYNQFNIFLLESSDIRFQEEFMAYWNGFIKPVSKFVLSHHEKSYFIRNLNDFNLRWNVLNVELTKRNKKVPKQVKTLLKTMHNRWNNILKVTLR